MANDDIYIVTNDWTAIAANGADITNGTFGLQNRSGQMISLVKSDTPPAVNFNGTTFMSGKGSDIKQTLTATELWYAKTKRVPAVQIAVVTI